MNSPVNFLEQPHAERRTVKLTVNSHATELTVPVSMSLAELLRERLQLLGTKIACNQAACGACTVLQYMPSGKARPIFACHTLAVQMNGANVVTIEGLSINGELDPLQQAFIDHDALQCGFCTPGMIMALKGALGNAPSDRPPRRDDIARAISGNVCRCGAYQQILDAAVDVVTPKQ